MSTPYFLEAEVMTDLFLSFFWGYPGGSGGKESAWNAGDLILQIQTAQRRCVMSSESPSSHVMSPKPHECSACVLCSQSPWITVYPWTRQQGPSLTVITVQRTQSQNSSQLWVQWAMGNWCVFMVYFTSISVCFIQSLLPNGFENSGRGGQWWGQTCSCKWKDR